jgi:hypothetical protein
MKSSDALPIYRVRRSKIHGTGVFAARDIRKGTRICEYVGDRISHAEADRRYEDKADDDNHTFLFTVDNRIVIDGGVGGNDAKYINHSCDPNCETVIDDRRVFVEAIRAIPKGTELGYDYLIERDDSDPPDIDVIWACRCGAETCRGTMLLPRKKARKKAGKSKKSKKAKRAVKKGVSEARAKSGAKSKFSTKSASRKSSAKPNSKSKSKVKAKAR